MNLICRFAGSLLSIRR